MGRQVTERLSGFHVPSGTRPCLSTRTAVPGLSVNWKLRREAMPSPTYAFPISPSAKPLCGRVPDQSRQLHGPKGSALQSHASFS
jgi:hypothetical protein